MTRPPAKKSEMLSTRDGFGIGLVEAAARNKNIVVVTADVAESTRVLNFAQKFPQRFFDVGVAEQNLAGVGAGLAAAGKIPFITSYAAFSPGRNWDQIRVSIAYSQLPVKIIGAHAGVSTGHDGATHQALEDIALMRVLPNMVVLSPCDAEEARKAVHAAVAHPGPVYLRLTRAATPAITNKKTTFAIGAARVLRTGRDLTIITTGPITSQALLAAEFLQQHKIDAEIINCSSLKPLDEHTILRSVRKTGCVVTVEEHQNSGGLFGAVAEFVARTLPIPVLPIGVPDTFTESGTPAELMKKYGLDAPSIVSQIRAWFDR